MKKRKSAGYEQKKRNSAIRERNPIILISLEGYNKTEKQYFQDLKREFNLQIHFAPGNSTDPVNMVEALVKEYNNLGLSSYYKDVGFCVVDADFDKTKNKQITEADAIAGRNGVSVIVSNPCFEVWFLCHYCASTKKYNSYKDVESELKKYLPNYTKNLPGVFSLTKAKLSDAVKNAKILEAECFKAGNQPHSVEFSPSTEIYKVVELMEDVKGAAEVLRTGDII